MGSAQIAGGSAVRLLSIQGKGIVLCGKKLKIKSPEQAVKEGIGYIPDDRVERTLWQSPDFMEHHFAYTAH